MFPFEPSSFSFLNRTQSIVNYFVFIELVLMISKALLSLSIEFQMIWVLLSMDFMDIINFCISYPSLVLAVILGVALWSMVIVVAVSGGKTAASKNEWTTSNFYYSISIVCALANVFIFFPIFVMIKIDNAIDIFESVSCFSLFSWTVLILSVTIERIGNRLWLLRGIGRCRIEWITRWLWIWDICEYGWLRICIHLLSLKHNMRRYVRFDIANRT